MSTTAPRPGPDDPAIGRHQRAKQLFLAACEYTGEAQSTFVAAQCGEDAALRAEVEAMLAADDEADGFLATPATLPPGTAAALERIAGERGYRMLRRLGAGGMGEVWLAERDDGTYVQQVAVKLMHTGAQLSREALRRFRAERQILAALVHPFIARLLDGGTLPEGTPYLVMEYVDGAPVDQWADDQGLDVRARLALFLKICAAVQHAHQSLVIHRDLKPSNILVDRQGTPRLLDFGIAKVLSAELLPAQSVLQTGTGMAPMTLAYASPEQVRGQAVGTPSDVYALGVVLYQLLTGALPYRHTGTDPLALSRAVCEQVPELPSRAAAAAGDERTRRFRLQLDGDLDAILLKCLRKEPAERYPGVDALAADLQRHLDGLPVQARRGSRWYAMRKFVSRHRWAVAGGLLLVLLLSAFGLDRQRQLAATAVERDRARQLVGFLTQLFDNADPDKSGGRKVVVADVLDSAARRAEADTAQQPLDRAALLHTLGSAYLALGDHDRADGLLGQAYALRTVPEAAAERADTALQLATLRTQQHQPDAALPLLEEAVDLRRAQFGADDWRSAEAATRLAMLARERGQPEQAQRALMQLVSAWRQRAGLKTDFVAAGTQAMGRDAALALADALLQLGMVAHDRKDWAVADPALAQSLAIYQHWLGENDPRADSPLATQANVAREKGELKQALALREQIVAHRTAAYGPAHWRTGIALVNLGDSLGALARYDEAHEVAVHATAILEAALGPNHPYTLIALGNQSNLREGDPPAKVEQALAVCLEVLRRREAVLPPGHADIALAHYAIANKYAALHRPAEALAAYDRSFALYAAQYGPEHPYLDENRISEADVLVPLGQRDEAIARLRKVVAHDGHPEASAIVVALARFRLADLLVEEDRGEAMALAEKALEAALAAGTTDTLDPARVSAWLAAHGGSATPR